MGYRTRLDGTRYYLYRDRDVEVKLSFALYKPFVEQTRKAGHTSDDEASEALHRMPQQLRVFRQLVKEELHKHFYATRKQRH